ncbi:DUF4910 domain-containing protein [Dasania marina]|uniref:DUF4910 domain-containing protein n=1 Tax=Dasania marina TaxID=471499 RepID=UPI000362A7AA|nr:DUF4910 domain-containing protein [Dasania marina]
MNIREKTQQAFIDGDEKAFLSATFDELWPITRSISGPGIEESLAVFKRHMPIQIEKVATGTKVFDWVTPQEWHFKRAVLTAPDGSIICDSNDSNLHVLNYSTSIDKKLDLNELLPHLYSLPNLPTAIPYVTSYYKKNWGFCISDQKKKTLTAGTYHAKIESDFVDGGIPFGQCLLPGESKKEILLSSYLCHPSLANNELSGPLVLLALYRRIQKWPKRRYSYRFLLNPETIGALCFLHTHGQKLSQNIISGMVLTCLGGPVEQLRYKASRNDNSLFDKVANAITGKDLSIAEPLDYELYSPLGGSDERQYGSPGFNLPVSQIARTCYGNYDGYHNSLDDKAFMDINSLIKSVDSIEQFLLYAEVCGKPINLAPYGEPQLGPRGLYPNVNAASTRANSDDKEVDGRTRLHHILQLLSLADGQHDLFYIAEKCQCSIDELKLVVELLEQHQLMSY